MADHQTKRQQLYNRRLAELGHPPLRQLVLDRRRDFIAWRLIAQELAGLLGEDITGTTVWKWYKDEPEFIEADKAAY